MYTKPRERDSRTPLSSKHLVFPQPAVALCASYRNMSAILTLNKAERGADGVPVATGANFVILSKVVALRTDMTVAWSKQEVADAVGLGVTSEKEGFECDFPSFKQFVKVNETFDHYLIKPQKGWKKTPTLNFYTEIRKGGETRRVVGTYVVDLSRDAEGVAIIPEKCSCCCARLLRAAKLPHFRWPFSGCCKKGNTSSSASAAIRTKSEPFLVISKSDTATLR